LHGGDVAVVVRVDGDDVINNVLDTEILDTVLAQEQPELAGVEVIRIVCDRCVLRRCDLLGRFALRA
jgi:hypothetical protein